MGLSWDVSRQGLYSEIGGAGEDVNVVGYAQPGHLNAVRTMRGNQHS